MRALRELAPVLLDTFGETTVEQRSWIAHAWTSGCTPDNVRYHLMDLAEGEIALLIDNLSSGNGAQAWLAEWEAREDAPVCAHRGRWQDTVPDCVPPHATIWNGPRPLCGSFAPAHARLSPGECPETMRWTAPGPQGQHWAAVVGNEDMDECWSNENRKAGGYRVRIYPSLVAYHAYRQVLLARYPEQREEIDKGELGSWIESEFYRDPEAWDVAERNPIGASGQLAWVRWQSVNPRRSMYRGLVKHISITDPCLYVTIWSRSKLGWQKTERRCAPMPPDPWGAVCYEKA